MKTCELPLLDAAATQALGDALGRRIERGGVVYLIGELGAGKTTLARALIQALLPQARVKSPTYSLLETYETALGPLHHLDLYRIADPSEVEYLGVAEDDAAVWLIEWPERGADAVPKPDLLLHLEHRGEARHARLTACTPAGLRLMDQVAKAGF